MSGPEILKAVENFSAFIHLHPVYTLPHVAHHEQIMAVAVAIMFKNTRGETPWN